MESDFPSGIREDVVVGKGGEAKVFPGPIKEKKSHVVLLIGS